MMLMTRERGTMKWTLRGEEELGSFFCNSFFFFFRDSTINLSLLCNAFVLDVM
jgi:hypothetical protein